MKKHLLSLVLVLLTYSAHAADVPTLDTEDVSKKSFTVMAYNVENFFDAIHDAGKDDWTYLPMSVKKDDPNITAECRKASTPYYIQECLTTDWSKAVVATKIKNIASVIRSYDNGKGPDVVIFEEVENLNVIQMLVQKGLSDLGYKTLVLMEGKDNRGIDTALISRFPLASKPVLHAVGSFSTRGVLEVPLKIGKKTVAFFGNHWPSQSNPDANRVLAAQTLQAAAVASKADIKIAGGDFNTLDTDSENGLTSVIMADSNGFYDTRLIQPESNAFPTGSHWYKGKWQYLDRLFINKAAIDNKQVRSSAFAVYAPKFILKTNSFTDRSGRHTEELIPNRFNAEARTGYADHLPITLEVEMN